MKSKERGIVLFEKFTVQYIKEPAFFKKFSCIGDKCPVNCCYGWNIGWKKPEIEKLKNAQMSDSLRRLVDTSFIPVTDNYYKNIFDYEIKFNEGGKCPMLNENGLCSIQKELGEEYLSYTCMSYPRFGFICDDVLIRTCQCSCVHIMDMICSDENSMELENKFHKNIGYLDVDAPYSPKDYMDNPAIKCRKDLFNFFYEILSNKSCSIDTSIVLCAMAAQKIDQLIKQYGQNRLPEVLDKLKPQLNDPVQIKKLERARQNLSLKANISIALLRAIHESASFYSNVFENGIPSEEKWAEGVEKFNLRFKDKPWAMRNIALNLFISQGMPFVDRKLSVYENFCYFAAEFAAIKFLAPVTALEFEQADNSFEVVAAYVIRAFSHAKVNIKNVLDVLNEFGCTTPAYLMGILK